MTEHSDLRIFGGAETIVSAARFQVLYSRGSEIARLIKIRV